MEGYAESPTVPQHRPTPDGLMAAYGKHAEAEMGMVTVLNTTFADIRHVAGAVNRNVVDHEHETGLHSGAGPWPCHYPQADNSSGAKNRDLPPTVFASVA